MASKSVSASAAVHDDTVPTSAGLTSFNLLDDKRLLTGLGLQPGMHVLDFGCGVGNYALAASPCIGPKGLVYAVDLWEEGIETLEIRSAMAGIDNIRSSVCGAGDRLPIADHSLDICLLATVVHILVRENLLTTALGEIKRTLRPGGKLAIVEFYKQEDSPGPPLSWRLSPEALQQKMQTQGFGVISSMEVGPYNYLSLFSRDA